MTYAPSQLLTFEEFLAQYQDEPAFELADGELIEMEPTGPHEAVAGKVASQLNLAIAAMGVPWIIPRTCILRPLADQATARRPDVAVLDEQALVQEPYGNVNLSLRGVRRSGWWWRWSAPTGKRTMPARSRNMR
jgi:Uma2 family endonuclease